MVAVPFADDESGNRGSSNLSANTMTGRAVHVGVPSRMPRHQAGHDVRRRFTGVFVSTSANDDAVLERSAPRR